MDEAGEMMLVSPKMPDDEELGMSNESTGTSVVLEDRHDKLMETMAIFQTRNGQNLPWDGAAGRRGRGAEKVEKRGHLQKAQRRILGCRGSEGRDHGANGVISRQD